jgi:cytochrome P450
MKRHYPKGPRLYLPLIILGQMTSRWRRVDTLAFALDVSRKYGDVAHYKFGPLHVYQLTNPDIARDILVERPERFQKPKLLKHAFRPFGGDGLVTSDGALWKQQRKLMQPAFQHRQLAGYADDMVAFTTRWMNSFADGDVREINGEMATLTIRIVVKSLFGGDLPADADDIGRSMLALLEAANERVNSPIRLPSWAPTPKNLREKRAVVRLDAILQNLIRTRRASTEPRNDLLSTLLAAVDVDTGARMSDRQLRDEMMTLFLAGHETTATALTWTWYLLGLHPEVEARLADELLRVLAGRAPTLSDLPELPYTEMVIRESIRLYPPAPGVAREPVEDVTIAGYEVPKGALLSINSFVMQRDPRFFPDPDRFDPNRFAPGWEERIPRYAYLPFGSGPRVCIGNGFAMMEARLILATVAQRYKLCLEPGQNIKPVQLVTLRPNGPIRMKLRRR